VGPSEGYYVIPDYLTSRLIIGRRRRTESLDRNTLIDAIREWFVLGGNLIVTRSPLTTVAWRNTPIQLDVRDSIVIEAISVYHKALEKKDINFLSHVRYWLYRTLQAYFQALEEKSWRPAGGTDLVFRRATSSLTGLPSLDSFISSVKQS